MKLNAVILAGTKNYRQFVIGKKKEYKQYLKLCDKYVIEYVIDAVLNAKLVDKIFIICDKQKIKQVLKKYSAKQRKRLHIIENKESLMENINYCFTNYTQKAILLPSDAPFLKPKDIDSFIKQVNTNKDYVIGFTDGSDLDKIFDKLSLFIKKERIKYGLFPIYNADIRISNLHFLDSTKIKKPELNLAQNIFNNRKLLDPDGRKNTKSWKNIAVACLRYLHQRKYHPAIILGGILAAFYGVLFYLAHKSMNNRIGKMYAFLIRPKLMEIIIWLLTAGNTKTQIIITKNLSPMLDIDLEENYLLLAKNNCSNFKNISKFLI